MAYYTALITAWNGATQPPTGVSGTGLSSNDTTTAKLNKVNAWTVTGTIPTNFYVTGNQLANCVNYTEFATLDSTQRRQILDLCTIPGSLLGGSGNTSLLTDGLIIATFASSGTTISNLTALATAQIQPWWSTPVASGGAGLSGPVSTPDLAAAGGLT